MTTDEAIKKSLEKVFLFAFLSAQKEPLGCIADKEKFFPNRFNRVASTLAIQTLRATEIQERLE